jgi:hypothetical protein
MKRTLLILAAIAMVAAMVAVGVAQEKPWFDMKNCDFCKVWTTPEMMKNVTYEQHNISNGVLTASFFPESFRESYKKASTQMDVLGQKAGAGEKVQMCGSCEKMGTFFMRGMKMEEVYLRNGVTMLMTSTDSSLVADMHNWAQRNADEEKKMKAAEKK